MIIYLNGNGWSTKKGKPFGAWTAKEVTKEQFEALKSGKIKISQGAILSAKASTQQFEHEKRLEKAREALAHTDWLAIRELEQPKFSAKNLKLFKAYRQQLRDYTNQSQNGNYLVSDFPDKPEFIS